jgi:hypothetical protein
MKHTSKVTLEYHRESGPLSLKSYVDLDWVSSEEHKSTSKMVHLLNDSVIAWSSKKQATIALATREAEYIAVSKCTREVVYLRQLLSELNYPQHTLTRIHEDNQIYEVAITLINTRMKDQFSNLFTKQQTVK